MTAPYPSFAQTTSYLIYFVVSIFLASAFSIPLKSKLILNIQRFHRTKLCQSRYHVTSSRSHDGLYIKNHIDLLCHHDHVKNEDKQDTDKKSRGRRAFFQAMLTSSLLSITPERSNAQFVKFPCVSDFANTYHFLRAGESLLEEEGIWTTNPLIL